MKGASLCCDRPMTTPRGARVARPSVTASRAKVLERAPIRPGPGCLAVSFHPFSGGSAARHTAFLYVAFLTDQVANATFIAKKDWQALNRFQPRSGGFGPGRRSAADTFTGCIYAHLSALPAAIAASVMLVAVSLLFCLVFLVPGDPASVALGPRASEAQKQASAPEQLGRPYYRRAVYQRYRAAGLRGGDLCPAYFLGDPEMVSRYRRRTSR